ncbi:MAG: hypothetical protein ACH350_03975 [Parachlamydiaceae bacterium]
MSNSLLHRPLIGLILIMAPLLNGAQERWDYSTPDNTYGSYYYSGQMGGGYRGNDGFTHFTVGLNDINYITSGISSYQGTSTGPGPNGGYPGAPRGIYQTHYVDTSIYPNSYMHFQSR